MTWTYTSTDLSTELAQIRLMIGDTDSSDPLLTDEEIAYFTGVEGTTLGAAARCCDTIAAKFARMVDKSEGQLSISASQKAKQYRELAQELRIQSACGALPTAGGIFKSDKDERDSETDRVKPAFAVGMMDYDYSVSSSSTE